MEVMMFWMWFFVSATFISLLVMSWLYNHRNGFCSKQFRIFTGIFIVGLAFSLGLAAFLFIVEKL